MSAFDRRHRRLCACAKGPGESAPTTLTGLRPASTAACAAARFRLRMSPAFKFLGIIWRDNLDRPGILCRGPRRYSFRRVWDGFGARREAAGLIKRRPPGGGRCEERNEEEINFPDKVRGGGGFLRFFGPGP